ncbi:MAG TPA: NADH:flavin oxidoreductase, partial [Steroidobacteraceae bacterium]|nr:NADH:flavin oxidoreductase [Steroidobacteraceae bacterium]
MWRPPERIRHDSRPANWPSAESAAASRLFSPVKVGPVSLRHRTWVPAMVPWRATDDGFVSQDVLDWYKRFAAGRPGALVVEATGIRDVPSGPLLRIGDERFLPGLRQLVEVVRRASDGETRLFIQLIDFLSIRRRPEPARYFRDFLTVTERHRAAFSDSTGAKAGPCADLEGGDARVRRWLATLERSELEKVLDVQELAALDYGARERVTDMHLPHIRELPLRLPELFGSAARRAREAGFDGVELHYAHAYTMASFLSPLNVRSDGYGGSVAERVRLPLEVYARVRGEVGADFAVGCRFLAEECISGGGTVEDAEFIACAFAGAGMDFLSLSRGGKFDDAQQPKVGAAAYPYTGRSGYECMPSYFSDAQGPFGRNLGAAARILAAVRAAQRDTPLVASGGIHNFAQAEAVLASGQADIVGMARQALADPDWFTKVRLGRGAEVRLCLYTNYCEALDQRHRQVTCELWDREAL